MPAQYDLPPWIDKLSIEDAVKLMLFGWFGATAPASGGGGASVPPTVNGVKVVGIQEVDTWSTKSADYTEPAGALSIAFKPLTGFTGTVNGQTWAFADGAVSAVAQPGNTRPAFVITRSGGSYILAVSRPA